MKKAAIACVITACAASPSQRPVTPTTAGETKGLSICWRQGDEGYDGVEASLRAALLRHLVSAGYTLLGSSCDVSLTVSWSISGGDFRSVRVALRDQANDLITPIYLAFGSGEMPAAETDRVATVVVNQINVSAPLVRFVRKRDEAHAILIRPSGITIRKKPTFTPQLMDVEAVRSTFASMSPGDRIDVTIEPHAQWRSVVQAFDVLLMAQRGHLRVHAGSESADIDIANAEGWREHGTWLAVGVYPSEVVGRWRTDRKCTETPPNFAIESDAPSFEAMTMSLERCAGRCIDRLVLGGTVEDSSQYIDAILVSSRGVHAPLTVDVHGVYQATSRCAEAENELIATLDKAKNALRVCSPKYHGVLRATIQIARDGGVERVVVLFVDEPSVPDDVKTCAARELQRIPFPPDDHERRVVHAYDL